MPYSLCNSYAETPYLFQYICFYIIVDIAVIENRQQGRILNFCQWTLYHDLQR